MCGIVSLVANEQQEARSALVSSMCGLLAHRGPDDEGLYTAPFVPLTLGHRRLSIIDLSKDGHQPMHRGPLTLAFNGEIYNYLELRKELAERGHVFVTRSDTEVLLAAFDEWGLSALSKANGMFAILLYDHNARTLCLIRDRFGVKPLYYLYDPGRKILLSASEPKAVVHGARVLQLPLAVDRRVLSCYLADAPTEEDEDTFIAPIRRVLPGEAITFVLSDAGVTEMRRQRWYFLRPKDTGLQAAPHPLSAYTKAQQDEEDARFLDLFTDAVRLRQRSDVPVGTCLSGGLDSSAIVCISALRLGVRPQAFSAVYGKDDQADESRFIDEVVEKSQVESHRINPGERFSPDDFVRFIKLHDEPVGGTSVWAQHCVFRLAREHGITVMLDGQGADETLTGYRGAFPLLYADYLRRGDLWGLRGAIANAKALHGIKQAKAYLQGLVAYGRLHLVPKGLYDPYLEHKWHSLFGGDKTPGFHLQAPPLPQVLPFTEEWHRVSPLHGYLYQLTFGASLQTILRYEDRNSMAASIEARAPFLDYRLVAHCLRQPASALVQGGYTKSLLRRTLVGILPEAVRLRVDKIGFATPERAWLRGPLRPLLSDLLASREAKEQGFLDIPALQKMFHDLCNEPNNWTSSSQTSYALFKALNVALWLGHFRLNQMV